VVTCAQGSSAVQVCAPDDPRWLAFTASHPDATLFHHPAWSRVLRQTYGYRTLVLAQTDRDDAIVAGMPAVEMSGFRGRRLVALPFTDHCPPLADSSAALQSLARNLVAWRQSAGARALLVHGALPVAPGIRQEVRAVRHLLSLSGSSQEIFTRLHAGPVGRAIRKAQREGVTARVSTSPDDLVSFYQLHLETRRRLGVPVQPRRFVQNIWRECIAAGFGFVVIASWRSKAIATGLFLAWNGTLIYKFGASDPQYWHVRPNNLVMRTAIEHASGRGFRWLDFGRSDHDNQGLRDFKRRWGASEIPLVYSVVGDRPAGRRLPGFAMHALTTVIRTSPPIVCRAIGELLYRKAAGRFA